jgi:hypothetical protein
MDALSPTVTRIPFTQISGNGSVIWRSSLFCLHVSFVRPLVNVNKLWCRAQNRVLYKRLMLRYHGYYSDWAMGWMKKEFVLGSQQEQEISLSR